MQQREAVHLPGEHRGGLGISTHDLRGRLGMQLSDGRDDSGHLGAQAGQPLRLLRPDRPARQRCGRWHGNRRHRRRGDRLQLLMGLDRLDPGDEGDDSPDPHRPESDLAAARDQEGVEQTATRRDRGDDRSAHPRAPQRRPPPGIATTGLLVVRHRRAMRTLHAIGLAEAAGAPEGVEQGQPAIDAGLHPSGEVVGIGSGHRATIGRRRRAAEPVAGARGSAGDRSAADPAITLPE